MKTIFKYQWGASLSQKECRAWGIDIFKTLSLAVDELNIRQFRLMGYWDEIEKTPGSYSFKEIDKLLDLAHKKGASVSFCLGLRQPRWPESHQPEWAKQLKKDDYNAWELKLKAFIKKVVNRYKTHPAIDSWQLENEALNRGFGVDGDFNRKRLRSEFNLVKKLDSTRPVIMSVSNIFLLPIRAPRPDYFGFTFYSIIHDRRRYVKSIFGPTYYKLRAWAIKLTTGKSTFIHELQAEPWGPKPNTEMTIEEMDQSMNVERLKFNLISAQKSGLAPYFLWGLEWWYALKLKGENKWWEVVKSFTK